MRWVLSVLAVLTGLLAMHGPATAGLPDVRSAGGHAMPVSAMAPGDPDGSGGGECAHAPHGADGHPHHADPTCAAAGTSGAPILPALSPTAAAPTAPASAVRRVPAGEFGVRAPPSLSELQLLRI
ncbi:DUF6153 family protein [Streptomyces macrosporus]|uniref:DUF6153 family protein n=2 Tax=Streptomyces macrosporus TaxID=44032 RepID=A0ABN3JLD2_9ACTN